MKSMCLNLLLSLAIINGFAQDSSANANSVKIIDTASMARIYVIRSTGHVGSAVNLRILVDGARYCKVRNNHYAMFYVQPGTHMFNATSWDKPGADEKFALKLPVEPGKIYYTSMHIKQRFFGIEISLEEITYNSAAPLLEKYKLDQCD